MAELISVGTNSWATLAEAETYFLGRLNARHYWNADAEKEPALITAYKQIINSGIFSGFPTTTSQLMKDAQCEQALFLLAAGDDLETRQSLQAQGVKQAGLVKETYDGSAKEGVIIAPVVLEMLDSYLTYGPGGFAVELERDEDEDLI